MADNKHNGERKEEMPEAGAAAQPKPSKIRRTGGGVDPVLYARKFEPNCRLACNDGKFVGVRWEQICRHSPVFFDMDQPAAGVDVKVNFTWPAVQTAIDWLDDKPTSVEWLSSNVIMREVLLFAREYGLKALVEEVAKDWWRVETRQDAEDAVRWGEEWEMPQLCQKADQWIKEQKEPEQFRLEALAKLRAYSPFLARVMEQKHGVMEPRDVGNAIVFGSFYNECPLDDEKFLRCHNRDLVRDEGDVDVMAFVERFKDISALCKRLYQYRDSVPRSFAKCPKCPTRSIRKVD